MHSSSSDSKKAMEALLSSTSDPAFCVDEKGRLTGWNRAAERLLGYTLDQVAGRACCEIVSGRDVFDNPFCQPDCPLLLQARNRKPVRHFEMEVQSRDGELVRVRCFAMVLPRGPRSFSIVHLLRPVGEPSLSRLRARARSEAARLTQREFEVLRLLQSGHTTEEMADRLNVTISTVRKHVENLLRKLEVRSRLEAVLVGFEQRLL